MKKRPIFLSIMIFYSIFTGIAVVGNQILTFKNFTELISSFDVLIVAIYAIVFVGVLELASGIGMLKGYKWGWYLAVFNYMYCIVQNAVSFGYSVINYNEISVLEGNITNILLKYGLRVGKWSIVVILFFSEKLFDYFELDYPKRKIYAVKIFVISLLLNIVWDTIVRIK